MKEKIGEDNEKRGLGAEDERKLREAMELFHKPQTKSTRKAGKRHEQRIDKVDQTDSSPFLKREGE